MEAEMIKEALLEVGWKASFAFPTASKENMKLIELLAETKASINESTSRLEMYKERNRKLEDHLALILTERKLTEQLTFEVDKEIEDLEHFIKLAEHENRRTVSDHKRLIDQKMKVTSRLESLENEIFLKSNELQNIKSEVDYDQKLMEKFISDCQTENALKQRVEALTKAENFIIGGLNSEERKLSEKRRELHRKLDTIAGKNQVMQLQIDGMAEMSREENKGRQEMLQLWEKTIKQLADRDEDFSKLGKDYDELLSDINERLARIRELEKLLGSIGQDIKEAKAKASELNRDMADLRSRTQVEKADSATTQNELEALKKNATRVSGDLLQQRTYNSHTKTTTQQLSVSLQATEKAVKATRRKLENVQKENISTEDYLRLVEEELDAEVQCQDSIRRKITALKNKRYALKEEKNKAEGEKKTIEILNTGSRQKIQYVEKEMANDELELKRMEKFIYNAMYTANSLDSRILRMETNKTFDIDGVALEEHVRHLQIQYDDQCQSSKGLSNMIDQFFNEKRLLYLQTVKLKDLIQKESNRMVDANVYLINANRSLEAAIRDRNELLVFFNLCGVQLKRAEERNRLWKECSLSAEVRSKAIAALTRELEEESSARTFKIRSEMQILGQEIFRIKADFSRSQRRVEQLKSRYDIETSAISGGQDMGFEKAHLHLIVKSLVEHTELRAKGDELNQEIKKATEELKALENTLLVMNVLNENARSNGVTPDLELTKNKQDLEEKFKHSYERFKVARDNRRFLRANILRLEAKLGTLEEDFSKIDVEASATEAGIATLQKTNVELEKKLQRAMRSETLARTKALQSKLNMKSDIEVKLLQDFTESANNLLTFNIKSSPNVSENILTKAHDLCKKFGLKTPVPDKTRASDRQQGTNSRTSTGKAVEFDLADMPGLTDSKTLPSRKSARESSKTYKSTIRPVSSASSATLSICSVNDFLQ